MNIGVEKRISFNYCWLPANEGIGVGSDRIVFVKQFRMPSHQNTNMNKGSLRSNTTLFKVGFVALAVAISYIVAHSSTADAHPGLIITTTIVLILIFPLTYLFFSKKTKVSTLTVVSLFISGTITASLILPSENQGFLQPILFFVVPFLELGILLYVGFASYKWRKTYALPLSTSMDVMENLREILVKELPNPILGKVIAFEVAVIYYALIGWKRKRGEVFFTYHKENSVLIIISLFIFLIAVETFILHIMIAKWSVFTARILTSFSIYFVFQLFAHGKAILLRPVEIKANKIFIRCGLIGDAVINTSEIETIEVNNKMLRKGTGSIQLSPVGKATPPNLKITLRNKTVMNGFYGRQKEFTTIFLTIDAAAKFKQIAENL